jgi:hypothetical protein
MEYIEFLAAKFSKYTTDPAERPNCPDSVDLMKERGRLSMDSNRRIVCDEAGELGIDVHQRDIPVPGCPPHI